MPSAEKSYRSSPMDRVFADTRIVTIIGPIAGLDVDRTRRTLAAAEIVSAEPHVALEPASDSSRWHYRTGIAGDNVIDHSGYSTEDIGSVLTDIRNREGSHSALNVIITGDYLAVDYSHGIGDGQIGLMLLATLCDDADGALVPGLAVGLPASATWKALWRHYSRRPAALREFWRLRTVHKRPAEAATAITRRIENWEAGKVSRAAYMDRPQVAELTTWARSNTPGATTASISIALWCAALRAEGLAVDEHVMVLFNSRRYLDKSLHAAHGNFAVGIPLHLPPNSTPLHITDTMRQVIDSGWPAAILGMAKIKDVLSSARSAGQTIPEPVVEVPDRVRLAVSDLGKLRMFDHLQWADDGRNSQFGASLEPDGPDGMTMLVGELNGRRTFTASFCDKMIDPSVVDAALKRMCTDPVAVLRACI